MQAKKKHQQPNLGLKDFKGLRRNNLLYAFNFYWTKITITVFHLDLNKEKPYID